MDEQSLEIITTLIERIEQLEARLQAVEEPLQVANILDRTVKANCPKAHAIIAGIVAYNKARNAS